MSVPAGWDITPTVQETLLTLDELCGWLRKPPGSLDTDSLAPLVIWAASLVVREAGSLTWNLSAVPERAKFIATMLAKDYIENPKGLSTDTVGPLTETRPSDMIRQMRLTDDEKKVLAGLAGKADPINGRDGLFVIPTTTGLEGLIEEDLYVTDQSGTDWEIPWVSLGDNLYPRI